MMPTIAAAVSGGVDSLVTAHLLQQSGHRVFGLHFLTGFESIPVPINRIAEQLHIPVETIDIRDAFKRHVVDYFTATYKACKTPNPCLVCNPSIKFGILYDFARKKGANRLATGHYARITRDSDGRCHLLDGIDSGKNQAYFLAFLSQSQLSRACFPLGELTKSEVRARAAEAGLKPVTADESQDVCFIRGTSYGDFLTCRQGLESRPGEIVDEQGNILGRHEGLHLFTIGQRRGINCPSSEPYYVLQLDRDNNRLVVGSKNRLNVKECRVENINWIQPPSSATIEVQVKIRYRHNAVAATVDLRESGRAMVRFQQPEAAVTPGQGAVFYDNEEVLGGGFIV